MLFPPCPAALGTDTGPPILFPPCPAALSLPSLGTVTGPPPLASALILPSLISLTVLALSPALSRASLAGDISLPPLLSSARSLASLCISFDLLLAYPTFTYLPHCACSF